MFRRDAMLAAAIPGAVEGEQPPVVAGLGHLGFGFAQQVGIQVFTQFLQEGGVHEAESAATGADFLLHADYAADQAAAVIRRPALQSADAARQAADAAYANPRQWGVQHVAAGAAD